MKTAEEYLNIAHLKIAEDFDNGKSVGLQHTLMYGLQAQKDDIINMIDEMIVAEGIKHDNKMFSIKAEFLEMFHQKYQSRIDMLIELKDEIVKGKREA